MANPEWTEPGDWEDSAAEQMIARVRSRHKMRSGMPGGVNETLALELECVLRELERILAEQVSA